MKITKYWDIPLDRHKELQQWLHKKTFKLFNGGKYIEKKDFGLYKTPEDRFNKLWAKPSFWLIPDDFLNRKIDGKFEGNYKISIHSFLNEGFRKYINEGLKNKVGSFKVDFASKQGLIEKKAELHDTLTDLHVAQRHVISNKVVNRIIMYLEKNGVTVDKYEPHFSGSEDGRKTERMGMLLEDAEQAFRGVMCGFRYAYEWLIGEYINDDLIDELWENNQAINEVSKEYLAIQMALKYYESKRGRNKKEANKYPILMDYVRDCIAREYATDIRNKEYKFLTNERKVKPSPIARYLVETTNIEEDYSLRTIKRVISNTLLSEIEGLEKREKGYYKK